MPCPYEEICLKIFLTNKQNSVMHPNKNQDPLLPILYSDFFFLYSFFTEV